MGPLRTDALAKAIFITFQGCKNAALFKQVAIFTCSPTPTNYLECCVFTQGSISGGQDYKMKEGKEKE